MSSSEDAPQSAPMSVTAGDIPAERAMLERALGGRRGMIDSSVPTLVFLVAYAVTGNKLTTAIWAAVIAGAVIAGVRLVRRESVQQVVTGFAGVAISAFFASRTGEAKNYYVPGILTNAAYGVALLVSVLVGWPLIGVVVGLLTREGTAWRSNPPLRRAYAAATWIWVGVFAFRSAVQVPLYMMSNSDNPQALNTLGVAKIVMGAPLYLLAAYLTYRVLQPVLSKHRLETADQARAQEAESGSE